MDDNMREIRIAHKFKFPGRTLFGSITYPLPCLSDNLIPSAFGSNVNQILFYHEEISNFNLIYRALLVFLLSYSQ